MRATVLRVLNDSPNRTLANRHHQLAGSATRRLPQGCTFPRPGRQNRFILRKRVSRVVAPVVTTPRANPRPGRTCTAANPSRPRRSRLFPRNTARSSGPVHPRPAGQRLAPPTFPGPRGPSQSPVARQAGFVHGGVANQSFERPLTRYMCAPLVRNAPKHIFIPEVSLLFPWRGAPATRPDQV